MAFLMTAMLSNAFLSHAEPLPLRRKGLSLAARPVSSRSAALHAYAASQLGAELIATYGAGRSTAGGWLLLSGLEIHLGQSVLSPDLIGWRRERLPRMARGTSGIALAPDWVCEVLSPSTAVLDREKKMKVYAREGVRHLWLVDPLRQELEVYSLDGGHWKTLGTHAGQAHVHAEPFTPLRLELGLLWQR